MKKKILTICGLVIIICIIVMTLVCLKQDDNEEKVKDEIRPKPPIEENIDIKSDKLINDVQELNMQEFISDTSDITIIKTEKGGELLLNNTKIIKFGDTSSLRNSDYLGLNSAVLATKESSMVINEIEVDTNGLGSSCVVVNGKGANIEINDSKLLTYGERSRGLLATGGAMLSANNMEIKTEGYKSSAVATDTGGGNITISNSNIVTENEDSPGVYSTGTVYVNNVNIVTNTSESIVIDGYNLADINDSVITSNKKRGILMYYTGPKQQQITTAMLKMRNNKVTVKEGPAIYVTNTNADIVLINNNLNIYSGKLLEVCVDKYGELGQEHPVENPTGGSVKLTSINQKLNGDIDVDNTSELEIILEETNYTGYINNSNTAKNVKIKIDKNSVWNLTGDSYINELEVEDGSVINENGYKLIVSND